MERVDEKVYIAWRRVLRIRLCWLGLGMSLLVLALIGAWMHCHPVYEAKAEINYRNPYQERWQAHVEQLQREGRWGPDF